MQIVNGTSYHDTTSSEVIKILDEARLYRWRIRLYYGGNGKCWNDEDGTIGYIGRSTGNSKIPILVYNSRSMGGGAISDDKIVRIDTSANCIRYLDKSICFDHFISTDIGTVYNETTDTLYARCKNADSGKKLADFMNGKRWTK